MTSPFKFLDSYGLEDKSIFFGRDEEVEQLYQLIFQTRLMLVYGQSGTGKTSIIQCGLGNRFDPLDWLPIFVRRKDNINVALDTEIRRAAVTPIAENADTVAAIESLYLDHLRPIYIIFDQFEELYVLGDTEEQASFIATIKTIVTSETRCKVIISMREEYLAMLQDFERAVPTLFDSRLRIEPMKLRNVEQVITGTTKELGITLENGLATARRIIANISDRREGVQLSYLQVYLDKLYRGAAATATPLLFTDALVDQTGALDDVMADFLDEQTAAIQADITTRHADVDKDAVQRILEEMTTFEGTKQPMPHADLAARLPRLAPVLDEALVALEKSRILRCVDGIYELAHDSLAGRIADRRSSDRKALMRVEKLVKDGLARFEQTKTFLAPEELAIAGPILGQLNLTAAEAAFVKTSSDKARQQRLLKSTVVISIIAVLTASTLYAWDRQRVAEAALETASKTTNDMSLTIVDSLHAIPQTEDIRRALLKKAEEVGEELKRDGGKTNSNAAFWRNILEGDIAVERLDPEVAMREFGQARLQAKAASTADPTDPKWRRNLSVSLGRIAKIEYEASNFDAAAALYAEALRIDTAIAASDRANADWQRDLAVSNFDLGVLERQRGQTQAARAYLVKAAEITGTLLRNDRENRDAQVDWATTMNNLGELERDERNFAAARVAYGKATTALARVVEADPKRTKWRRMLALGWYNLAAISIKQAAWDGARGESDKALEQVSLLTETDAEALNPGFNRQRARIERMGGHPGVARTYAEKAVELLRLPRARDPKARALREELALDYGEISDIDIAQCDLGAARVAAQKSLDLIMALAAEERENPSYVTKLYLAHERIADIEHRAGATRAAQRSAAEALRIAGLLKLQIPDQKELQTDFERISGQVAQLGRGAVKSQSCKSSP